MALKDNLRKILVINLGGIGDLLLSTPALRALKNTYPAAHLSVLVSPRAGELAKRLPFIDMVYMFHASWNTLSALRKERFDLVITDVLMPRMDGFELTTRLKKDAIYKDIPVIIVTTRESDADKRRGLEAGADAYLLKSEFTSDILLDTIERLLG